MIQAWLAARSADVSYGLLLLLGLPVAARLLQVDYKTLHLKMKRYAIDAGVFRAS